MEAIRSWIADAFARENEALTKALKISLYSDSSASENHSSLPPPPPPFAESESFGPTASGSAISRSGNSIPRIPSGKIAKRKASSSKRSPTTYINADPADFGRMVQEVTGIQLGEAGVPVVKRARPEPDRSGMGRVGQVNGPLLEVCDMVGPVADGPLSECFPRLQSWGPNN